MRYCVVNLGCKVNRVESDSYEKVFAASGQPASCESEADVIVVNTCTVTGEAEKKTRKAVRRALRANDFARVVVTGCAAAIDPDVFRSMDPRVDVVAKADMDAYLIDLIERERCVSQRVDLDSALCDFSRTRIGVKVQDGCDNACTYCIVHVARGAAISRKADDIVSDVRELASAGVKEIVLSGINLGSYSCEGADLSSLLARLLDETASYAADDAPAVRFRVSSIEPADLDESFIDLLAASDGRICRHLHLPLQSGSSKVLAEMARPYDAQDYLQLVAYLRACVPDISLTTDVIVGFPGETDEDFQDTLDIARACEFSKIHVFPYSKREGTPAAQRSDQVAPEVKLKRAAQLRALSDELRARDFAGRAGSVELAVVEERGRAMTESYYEIVAPLGAPVGGLVEVMLRPDVLSSHDRMLA